MTRRLLIFSTVGIIVISFLFAVPSHAIEKKKPKGIFGIKVGTLSPAKAKASDGYTDNSAQSLTGGVFLEFPLFRQNILTGIACDLYKLRYKKAPFIDTSEYALDLSWTLKGNLRHNRPGVILRPGAAVGYGTFVNHTRIDYTGITLKGFTELVFRTRSNIAFLIELALVGSPHAGNEEEDYTVAPTLLLRGGLTF